MTSPHGTSVPEGSLVLVDPDYPAIPGRLVAARVPNTDNVTIKKLTDDAGRLFLKPLNPAYPAVEADPTCIIGAVREAKQKY